MNIERLSESGKTRSYDSPTRRAQAAETRAQIADAARRIFVERGWSATKVRDVAVAAGVSEPTVYAVFGSKAGLAAGLLESLEAAAGLPDRIAGLRAATGEPRRELAAMSALDRALFEQGADAITVIREAGRSVPELAEVYAEGRSRGDGMRVRVFGSWPSGTLRDGVSVEDACDASAALISVDVYLTLTRERGWSPARVEEWWTDTLAQLILA